MEKVNTSHVDLESVLSSGRDRGREGRAEQGLEYTSILYGLPCSMYGSVWLLGPYNELQS